MENLLRQRSKQFANDYEYFIRIYYIESYVLLKCDGAKNYEYFGELVERKVHVLLTGAVAVYFDTL